MPILRPHDDPMMCELCGVVIDNVLDRSSFCLPPVDRDLEHDDILVVCKDKHYRLEIGVALWLRQQLGKMPTD